MADNRGNTPGVTISDRRGGGAGLVMALILLVVIVVGGAFVYNERTSDAAKDRAIERAAKDIGEAATKAGDAAQRAVENAE